MLSKLLSNVGSNAVAYLALFVALPRGQGMEAVKRMGEERRRLGGKTTGQKTAQRARPKL